MIVFEICEKLCCFWFFGTVLDDLSKSARAHEKTFSKNKSAVWVNHRN
jgi:hypothetical protein